MATWDDVRRLALALPDTSEGTRWRRPTWFVGKAGFIWERPLSKNDVKQLQELGQEVPEGDLLGVRIEAVGVREAIIALDREGWVTVEPHRGAFVRGIDADYVRDHYELYGLVFGLMASRVAERADDAGLARVLRRELWIGEPEQVEFHFQPREEVIAARFQPRVDVAIERPRGERHRTTVGKIEIAQHPSRLRRPGQDAKRRGVGHHRVCRHDVREQFLRPVDEKHRDAAPRDGHHIAGLQPADVRHDRRASCPRLCRRGQRIDKWHPRGYRPGASGNRCCDQPFAAIDIQAFVLILAHFALHPFARRYVFECHGVDAFGAGPKCQRPYEVPAFATAHVKRSFRISVPLPFNLSPRKRARRSPLYFSLFSNAGEIAEPRLDRVGV